MATISENLEALKTAKSNLKTALERQGQDVTGKPFTQWHENVTAIKTEPNLQEKSTDKNGEVVADSGYDGLSKVTVNVPQPSGTIDITTNGTHNVTDYETANVNVQPNLTTKSVGQNGTYNASDDGVDGYSSVDVNVPVPDLSQTTATAEDVLEGKEFFNASGEKVAGTYKDMLQARIDETRIGNYLFYWYPGNNQNIVKNLDVSKVTKMNGMFSGCSSLTTLDLSSFNTSKVKDTGSMFSSSSALKTVIGEIDMISCTSNTNMFNYCRALETVTLKNIKISITIGSGTGYGHKLTLDSLLNTIKELHTNTDTGTKTLTMGTSNTAKLADVYVKLVEITDEMRAEDPYIDNKAPFVQCESTDEGAMLVTEYVTTVKNWKLA